MTRLFTDGLESADIQVFDIQNGSASSLAARSGTYSLLATGANTKILPSTYTSLYFRDAIQIPAAASIWNNSQNIIYFSSGTTVVASFVADSGGTFSLKVNGSVVVTTTYHFLGNTFYLVELYLDIGASGTFTLRVDGIQRATYTGATNGAAASIDRFTLSNIGGVTNVYHDDIGFNSTAGGADDSWLGDGHIYALTPNAAGDLTQFSVTGAASNYLAVDEIPPNGDTDYVYTSGSGQRDCYNLSNSGLSGVTISRVWVEMDSKIDVADGSTLGMFLRTSGSNFDDSNGLLPQTLSYVRYKSQEWLTNPATGVAWTVADTDSLQAGVRT